MRLAPDDMRIVCIGTSHQCAPVAVRERISLSGPRGEMMLDAVVALDDVAEVVAVDTCNRTELYIATRDAERALAEIVGLFVDHSGLAVEDLDRHLAVFDDAAAVEHLFLVAAGAEAVVLGETQIQGQLRDALEAARVGGSVGPLLDRLFSAAFSASRRVRSETRFSDGVTSVGSVAAQLATRTLGDLNGRTCMVVGAGDTSELVARHLVAHGVRELVIVNRGNERAQKLADAIDCRSIKFEDIDEEFARVDVVVSATSAPHQVITADRVEDARRAANARSQLAFIDLAVPRDVDPAVAALNGCSLFDLDDLESVVQETLRDRHAERRTVTTIVREEVHAFRRWQRERTADEAISRLHTAAEVIREREMERFKSRLGDLDARQHDAVELLTKRLVGKLLHAPTTALRAAVRKDAPVAPRVSLPDASASPNEIDPTVALLALDRQREVRSGV